MTGRLACFDPVLDFLFRFRPVQQFIVLYKKNALVAWRNRRATALRIIAPFLFLLLALLIDRALQANDRNNTDFQNVPNPSASPIGGIPQCTEDIFIGNRECIEVLYQPSPDPMIDAIMANVKANNPVAIKVQGFPNRTAIQTYLYDNPDTVISAVHFEFTGSTLEGFILQTNTTTKYFKGTFQNPNTFVQLPLQSAVHREIARYQIANSGVANATGLAAALNLETSLKEFAHPTIATVSVLGQVLGPFVFAACMFSFVIQISTVVAEKELGLKQALRTMGMSDSAYWTSWGLWEVTLAFVVANSICIYGLILQFDLFLHNSYGLLFFLFFLFQLAMSSLALLLAAFIRRTQVAVYLGFTIFIVGWIMQTVVLFGVPYTPDYYKTAGSAVTIIFSLLPWDLLAKGFQDLGAATVGTNPGLDWSDRTSYCQNIPNPDDQPPYNPREEYVSYECVMSLNTIYGIFIALWLGYFVLAVYFDNIVRNEFGVSKPFYYFLDPGYWFASWGRKHNNLKAVERSLQPNAGRRFGSGRLPPPIPSGQLDEDVKAEEDKMQSLLQHRTGAGEGAMALQSVGTGAARANAVEVYGLTKLYEGSSGCCGATVKCCSCCDCCSCEKTDDFWAIKGSWFSIEQGQLFCLLGPNGAGKTTTINCLTGAIPPTGGEALVYEEPISNAGGLDRIRAQMGVCPQFDILWNELTGAEHLSIYGHVKGLPWRKVAEEEAALLDKVKLTYAAGQRAGAYSGGMKRRLSVAIALLGDPRIVYLDEPTTGMDPISRRYVWDIIQEAKPGRAIVLTTHSMEEADILGDRIAIMARGKLRCIGTSLRLKQRFGSGYTLAVSVTAAASGHSAYPASQYGANGEPSTPAVIERRVAGVKRFFAERLGLAAPVEESKAYLVYLVDREREPQLNGFLKDLEAQRDTLGITDVQLSLTSLEEVFLNIARAAEVEAAASSGTTEVTHVLDDGSRLKIPVGAELVGHPTTGAAYRVRWGTDEAGRLIIMDCSELPPGSPEAAALAAANAGGAQPALGLPVGGAPPTMPGAYVPPLPVAPPVPSAALAAGHFPGHPAVPMSGEHGGPAGAPGGNGAAPGGAPSPGGAPVMYPGYNPSPVESRTN
ncbi:hypothetical protein HXX76_015459 [Chlamydomonas incerta]|uniref:ABC transporter domain-containing protein n=1 Tax=Chlamydomonas incerta TaxID=51695 RepID=A0A835VNG3_CHLIN|nr:hypothetical protein HXX76_015459 [Chlamydomonas incerta]|eukprot:KAG2423312.1 hypothetical protein HXX76_015459 [Chlamydomonas incerta]